MPAFLGPLSLISELTRMAAQHGQQPTVIISVQQSPYKKVRNMRGNIRKERIGKEKKIYKVLQEN